MSVKIRDALIKLINWIEKENYCGYDPYSYLNSPRFKNLKTPKLRFYTQQIGKYNQVNMFRFLSIKKELDPKALALIAKAYLKISEPNRNKYLEKGEKILKIIETLRDKGQDYYSWGFSFPWQSLETYLGKYESNCVVTSIVANVFLDYFEITKNKRYLNIASNTAKYFEYSLNKREDENYLCYSYTPHDNQRITDAMLFIASVFSKLYKSNKDVELKRKVKKIINYSLKMQRKDGCFLYGYGGKHNLIPQYDYHHGFMIDLLSTSSKNIGMDVEEAIIKGLKFYKETLFFPSGISLYRYPRKWPIDIHNQAQGIITFSKFEKYMPGSLEFAEKIASWTIENMQDKEGYFYYMKWPFFTNKIPYMRWSQVWMMLAMANMIGKEKKI